MGFPVPSRVGLQEINNSAGRFFNKLTVLFPSEKASKKKLPQKKFGPPCWTPKIDQKSKKSCSGSFLGLVWDFGSILGAIVDEFGDFRASGTDLERFFERLRQRVGRALNPASKNQALRIRATRDRSTERQRDRETERADLIL